MALQEEFEKSGNLLFKYRGTLPLVLFFITTIYYLKTEIYPETFILENTIYEIYYEVFCLVVGLIGLGIRIYTVGYSAKNTSGRNCNKQVADSVNTKGIYSIVRHPLYVGNFFMWFAIVLLTGDIMYIIIFCLIYWLYYERIMFAEEQYLRKKFGVAYTEWANNVPAFIPNFKLFEKPTSEFNWNKVIRQEKNGLLALFLIFSLYNFLGTLVEKSNTYNLYLIYATIFCVVVYVILRYLKKKTAILRDSKIL